MGTVCPFPENVRLFIYFRFITLRPTPQQTRMQQRATPPQDNDVNPHHHHHRVMTRCTRKPPKCDTAATRHNAQETQHRMQQIGAVASISPKRFVFSCSQYITLLILLQKTSSPVDATENDTSTRTRQQPHDKLATHTSTRQSPNVTRKP